MPSRRLLACALAALFAVPATAHATPAAGSQVPPQKTQFDLQAHRGGLGLTTD